MSNEIVSLLMPAVGDQAERLAGLYIKSNPQREAEKGWLASNVNTTGLSGSSWGKVHTHTHTHTHTGRHIQ